ncbi:MAG TPA: GntR family transcriptional regulator [Ideonella sp.]|uniref:GntR family transcriptional regulator n=1 Tax=Ideonella sp. TaxID=1929293 RepID=UPI002C2CC5FB|nr:GntR family transcriptional regulator [Ideonella sp.]HSI48714.1 GntR family transcriptional regulator [Ideonella sp.]
MTEIAATSTSPQVRTRLKRENATSLYAQIAARLQEEIEAGLFEPSGRLPSEAQIGERFQVSRVTVRLAFDKLAGEGRIVRRQGKGSYVAGKQVRHGLDTLRSFHESLRLQGLDAQMRLLEKRRVKVPDELAARFAPARQLTLLRRLHSVDGTPVALGLSHLPSALSQLSWQALEVQPAYALIAQLMGERPARADIAITACSADATLAEALAVPPGTALLVMERSSFLSDGRCCDHSSFYIRPERYAFTMSSAFRVEQS